MDILNKFINNLCGKFDNSEQIKDQISAGTITHPKSKHINGICNDKIKNLPESFNGYFIIEESYYENGNFKNTLPHLFLFTLNEDNKVVLTSYEIPSDIKKEDFRNDNEDLVIDFNTLKKSEKFTPMTYNYNQHSDEFTGESLSFFTPETKFLLKETVKNNTMYVSEVFYKNDKITFGFEDPIIYKKIK
ncbi:MAG: hypothetical protein Q4F66_14620 [Clostridium sp.]|nr:hypothetical protein [Clostridium sp.]